MLRSDYRYTVSIIKSCLTQILSFIYGKVITFLIKFALKISSKSTILINFFINALTIVFNVIPINYKYDRFSIVKPFPGKNKPILPLHFT